MTDSLAGLDQNLTPPATESGSARFSLRSLMLAVAVAALAAASRREGDWPLTFPAMAFGTMEIRLNRCPSRFPPAEAWANFGFVWLVTFIVEVPTSHISYHTLREAYPLGAFLLLAWVTIIAACLFAAGCRRFGLAILLVLVVQLLVTNITVGLDWRRLDRQVIAVQSQIEAAKLRTGAYPPDLTGLTNVPPSRIDYELSPSGTSYRLSYHVISRDHGWHYDSEQGTWWYDPF